MLWLSLALKVVIESCVHVLKVEHFEDFCILFILNCLSLQALKMNGKDLLGRAVRLDLARERGAYTPYSGYFLSQFLIIMLFSC